MGSRARGCGQRHRPAAPSPCLAPRDSMFARHRSASNRVPPRARMPRTRRTRRPHTVLMSSFRSSCTPARAYGDRRSSILEPFVLVMIAARNGSGFVIRRIRRIALLLLGSSPVSRNKLRPTCPCLVPSNSRPDMVPGQPRRLVIALGCALFLSRPVHHCNYFSHSDLSRPVSIARACPIGRGLPFGSCGWQYGQFRLHEPRRAAKV